MTGDPAARRALISALVAAANGPDPMPELCRACARELDVPGASMMVMGDDGPAPLAWSGEVGRRLEEIQRTVGEGPCVDAHRSGAGVSEPDLRAPRPGRWAAFGPAAVAAGAVSILSVPLRVGAVRLGALTLHGVAAGDLGHVDDADAAAAADVAVHAILAAQSGAGEGALGEDLQVLTDYSATVHQASGMVSVQLGVGVGEALVRIRAHAFVTGRPLTEVAADVVAGRLRLDR
ncbi:GAF and ANTAR domain-containing protein [Miltoncostaea oceani]|uniref:GAF and ANTAR domain-containing protein n=1 Tax=Miltoncostaea oceani TaxID=2843216 RepID=UPI001C3E3B72|nr:GAF and ANTAR domain-containing protein [Miltoncostaea oceani]